MKQSVGLSPSIVETWLLLATSSDPKLEKAKSKAAQQLSYFFGSVDNAIVYLINK